MNFSSTHNIPMGYSTFSSILWKTSVEYNDLAIYFSTFFLGGLPEGHGCKLLMVGQQTLLFFPISGS